MVATPPFMFVHFKLPQPMLWAERPVLWAERPLMLHHIHHPLSCWWNKGTQLLLGGLPKTLTALVRSPSYKAPYPGISVISSGSQDIRTPDCFFTTKDFLSFTFTMIPSGLFSPPPSSRVGGAEVEGAELTSREL